MNFAPTYIASLVGIIMAFQSFIGLDFASEQWTMFILMVVGIFTAIRQLITGRSTLLGGRPNDF